jgi:ATP-binding cassette subfamily F protein 3
MGYYDQHQQHLHMEKTVLDEIWDDFPQMEQADVRSVLGCFLFTGDEVFQPIHTLSGGERGRVALTRLMLRKDNFLLLDEPTNHLDMDSREVLEQALEDYPGTMLTVSHDRYFINRLANRVIELTPEGATFYLGNYDDYLDKKRQAAQGILQSDAPRNRTALEKERRRDRQAREAEKAKKERRLALEAQIEALEADIPAQEALLGQPEVYTNPERAKETAARINRMRAHHQDLLAQWEAEIE